MALVFLKKSCVENAYAPREAGGAVHWASLYQTEYSVQVLENVYNAVDYITAPPVVLMTIQFVSHNSRHSGRVITTKNAEGFNCF